MAIHLGHNDRTKVSAILEGTTLSLSSLTDASVEDQYGHVRLDSFPDLYHLLEQFRFLFMPTGCIDDDDVEPFFLELCDTLCGDGDGVGFSVGSEVCNLGFGSRLSRLVEGTGTEGISTDYA
jgi:hypothetical protein